MEAVYLITKANEIVNECLQMFHITDVPTF